MHCGKNCAGVAKENQQQQTVVKEITTTTRAQGTGETHQPTTKTHIYTRRIRLALLCASEKVVFPPSGIRQSSLSFSSLACLLIWHSLAAAAALPSTQPADAIFKMDRDREGKSISTERREKKKKESKLRENKQKRALCCVPSAIPSCFHPPLCVVVVVFVSTHTQTQPTVYR